jgi:AcrR family transcriptional regulator
MPKISQAEFAARRGRIMDAARSCFARHGIHVSVDEICAEAGVSKGAIYGYFTSKDAIIQAIADEHVADIDRVRSARGPEELRRILLESAGEGHPESSRLELEAWTYGLKSDGIRARLLANTGRLREAIASALAEMERAGEVTLALDADQAAAVIETFMIGAVAKAALGQDASEGAGERLAHLFDLVLRPV